jgi:hypothetical protein
MTDNGQSKCLCFDPAPAERATWHIAPAYVGTLSANIILSSIRPTRVEPDTLRSFNIFLDELLWLILDSARSLATNRLKAGLLQIMPSVVGKEAVLEAEIEVRAYRQRMTGVVNDDEHSTREPDFPLRPTFEVRILSCFGWGTMG